MNNLATRKRSLASRIAAACVVAVGVATVWFVLFMWVGSLVKNLFFHRTNQNEALMVDHDGTPVIETRTDFLLTNRRTLDGKPYPVDTQEWLTGAYLPQPYEPPGILETPLSWNMWPGRTAGQSDGKQSPTGWYLVRDNAQTGAVYLAGFDARTQQCVGHIGRNGFEATKPTESAEFMVPKTRPADGLQSVAEGYRLEPRSLATNQEIFNDISLYWTITLLETDRISNIDLRQRDVRTYAKLQDAASMGGIEVAKAIYDQMSVDANNFEPLTATEKENIKKADERIANREGPPEKFVGLTAVREGDRIDMMEFFRHKWKEFLLPEPLRDRAFTAYFVGADELMLWVWGRFDENWSGGPISRLVWINSQGQIQREEEVRLAGEVSLSLASFAWYSSMYVPMPIVWVPGFFGGAPAFMLQSNLQRDFASAFNYVTARAWPPLVVVVLVGLACAGIVVRLQRKYRRPNSVAWSAFAFVFGPAGLFAYMIEHRRANLEVCAKCGELVPRDRDACAACDTEFSPPARIGTEIFA